MIKKIIRNINPFFCLLFALTLILSQIVIAYGDDAPSMDNYIIVSMGDSYSSGEGISPYFGQGNGIKESAQSIDFLAHRSQYSWPGRLVFPGLDGPVKEYKNTNWYFTAVSGAKTEDFFNKQIKEVIKLNYYLKTEIPTQLSVFNNLPKNQVDYITLTIGGNDVGFEARVKEAFLSPEKCYFDHNGMNSEIEKTLSELESVYQPKLRNVYLTITELAGYQANLIVAGYPKLLAENDVSIAILSFGPNQAKYINNAVERFNKLIEDTVNDLAYTRNIYFVPVSGKDGFEGHEAYSELPYINEISLIADEYDIGLLIAGKSMHPTVIGADVYRDLVQKKIKEIEDKKNKVPNEEANYIWTLEQALDIHRRLQNPYYLTEGLGFSWDNAVKLGEVLISDIRKGVLDTVIDIPATLKETDHIILQNGFDPSGDWVCP